MKIALPAGAIAVALTLAACGGSSHGTSAASSTSASASSPQPSPSSQASASTQTTAQATSATSAVTPPPEVPRRNRRHSQHAAQTSAPSGAEIPAVFTIRAGGRLSPTVVSVPKNTTILVQATDGDSSAHVLKITGPHAGTLAMAPGKTASLTMPGLASGFYLVAIDGRVGARIAVGGSPGP